MAALLSCFLLSCAFVGIANMWRQFPREHPKTIQRTSLSLFVLCAVSWLPVLSAALQKGKSCGLLLGLSRHGAVFASIVALAATGVAYSGTFLFLLVERPPKGSWCNLSLHMWMKNIVVAPVAEEWVFRACMVPLMAMEGWSNRSIVLVSPLFFGLSHIHHAIREVGQGHCSLVEGIQEAALKVAYTTLFGQFAAGIFIATRRIIPCILVHAFCNRMGLPFHPLIFQSRKPSLWIMMSVVGIALFALSLGSVLNQQLYVD